MSMTPKKEFANWDDALAYANKLYNDGEISRNEIDKIARAAFTGSKGSKLDRLSSEQLSKLAKLVAAEKAKRHGKQPSGMSDEEFNNWTGLAVKTGASTNE
jgi:hypothetical protein